MHCFKEVSDCKRHNTLGPRYYLGSYRVFPSYFRMEARNFSPNSFRILSIYTVLISSVAGCWFCFLCPDELIYSSAEYNLFTYSRQFCIKNIPLSSDKFFCICHAVKHYLGPCSCSLPILPSPCLEQIAFSISFSVLPALSCIVSGVYL